MLQALGLAAAVSGTLTLSDRTEVRLRDPGDTAMGASLDFENAPEAHLVLSTPRMRYSFAYAPRLTFWDVNDHRPQPIWLDTGEARVDWRGRHARLSLDEAAAYGGVNFGALTSTPGPAGAPSRVDVVPTAQVLEYVSSTTTLASHLELPRWALDSSVGYQLSGGADSSSRAALPFQRGPLAEVRADFTAARRDHVFTTASASESTFSSGQEVVLVEGDEGWRHTLTRTTEAQLTAGASEARERSGQSAPNAYKTFPVAEASVEYRHPLRPGREELRRERASPRTTREDRIHGRIGLRLGPLVNRLTGTVDERAQATFEAGWSERPFGVRALLFAAQSVPDDNANAVSLLLGTLTFEYRASEGVLLDCGVRGLAQRQALALPSMPTDLVQSTYTQGVVFVGVTFRTPDISL